jgi:hypothetical protein
VPSTGTVGIEVHPVRDGDGVMTAADITVIALAA